MSDVGLIALRGIAAVRPGDDLAALIGAAARDAALPLRDGALVVCQKVVSKAEGRVVAFASGLAAIHALLTLVVRGRLGAFGPYCILVGVGALIWLQLG